MRRLMPLSFTFIRVAVRVPRDGHRNAVKETLTKASAFLEATKGTNLRMRPDSANLE